MGEHHEWFLKEALKGAPLIEVQLDEIWTFTQKKKASDNPEDIEAGLGETWAWTAIETATRLMLPWWIGGRELSDAREMLKGLVPLIQADDSCEPPLFTSDELAHYATVLLECFHVAVAVPRTGRPGRPPKPRIVPHPALVYATIHKLRKEGRARAATRNIVYGNEPSLHAKPANSPSNTINTAFVERSNPHLRSRGSRFARKSLGFAKSRRWLNAKMAITAARYNFVRPHGALIKRAGGAGRPTTRAMAAKPTDHPWERVELLSRQIPRR